jgi:glycogen debranching enzyme
MSSCDAGYNPIEYHNGTVWPHDTAIGVEGLRRYGFRDDAKRVAWALFEAAEAFDYSLLEVFAGYGGEATTVAVEYPTASRPQAWAAAFDRSSATSTGSGDLKADTVAPR